MPTNLLKISGVCTAECRALLSVIIRVRVVGTSGRNLLGGGYIEAATSSPAQSPHGLAPAAADLAAPAAGPHQPASRGRRVQVGTGAAALVDDEGVFQGRLLMLNKLYIRLKQPLEICNFVNSFCRDNFKGQAMFNQYCSRTAKDR